MNDDEDRRSSSSCSGGDQWALKLYCCAHDLADLFAYVKNSPFPSAVKIIELFRLEEAQLTLEWVPIDNEDILHVTDVLRIDVTVRPQQPDDPESIALATETLELIDLDHLALAQAELRALEVQDHIDLVEGDVTRLTVSPDSLKATLTALCNYALGIKETKNVKFRKDLLEEDEVSSQSIEKVTHYEVDEYPVDDMETLNKNLCNDGPNNEQDDDDEDDDEFNDKHFDPQTDEQQYRAHLEQEQKSNLNKNIIRIIDTSS